MLAIGLMGRTEGLAITSCERAPPYALEDESNSLRELQDWDDNSYSSRECPDDPVNGSSPIIKPNDPTDLGRKLKLDFEKKSMKNSSMKTLRSSLPIFEYKGKILDSIRHHPVTVLCAETGKFK